MCTELVPSLASTLNLAKNQINDTSIVDILATLPKLKVLYLRDNPVVAQLKQYRKTLVSRLPHLTYLDDRPVNDDERRCAVAW